jgi:hypothetical protein
MNILNSSYNFASKKKKSTTAASPTYTADEISTNTSFSNLITSKPPSFIFSPSVTSTLTNNNTQMKDVRSGYTSYATMSNVTVNSGTGRGATGTITYLSGSKDSVTPANTSKITFPTGSLPISYTVCSIIRYANASNQGRILEAYDENNILSHYNACPGTVYINGNFVTTGSGSTNNISPSPVTDWAYVCTRSNSAANANNAIVNNIAKGSTSWAPVHTANSTLAINNRMGGGTSEHSNFDFAYLFVWNQALTDAEMLTVSKKMQIYLKYGVMGALTSDELTNISFNNLITSKPPLYIFSPSVASTLTNNNTQMKDVRSGNNNYATMSGVTVNTASGNGATAAITYLSGTDTSTIIFPNGSKPTNYTICSVAKYSSTVGAIKERIFQDQEGLGWVYSHWKGNAGVFYNGTQFWVTPGDGASASNISNVNDWVVMCSRTNATATVNNILVNSVAKGSNVAINAIGQATITINGFYHEKGYFDFAYLYVWNQELTYEEMLTVSNKMNMYLRTGTM